MVFLHILRNFCATSSVKGLPRLVRSQDRCLCTLWVFTILFGAALATIQLYKLVSTYVSYSKVLSVHEMEFHAPFPDITVCNLNYPTARHDGIHFNMTTYRERLNQLMYRYPEQAHIKYDLQNRDGYFQNFDQVMFDQLDIHEGSLVVSCAWSDVLPCPKQSVYHLFSPEFHSCYTLRPNTSVDLGRVYSVDSLAAVIFLNDFSEETFPDILPDVSFSQAHGMKVIVHPRGSFPNIATGGVNIPTGYETSITLYPSKRVRLKQPYGECVDEEYLIPGLPYTYTQSACESLCHQSIVINECQCLYVYHLSTSEQRRMYPFCGKLEDDITKTIKRMNCLSAIPYDQYPLDMCQCLPRCSEYLYDFRIHQVPWPHESYHLAAIMAYVIGRPWEEKFGVYDHIATVMNVNKTEGFRLLRRTDLLRRNFLQLNAYFHNNEVKVNEDEPSLTFAQLLAHVGGALNLWIGISFITLVELLELFYHIIVWIPNRNKAPEDDTEGTSESTQKLTPPQTAVDQQESSL